MVSHTTTPEATQTASRVAIVTGAGGGIGRCIAMALADAGWCLALLDRDSDGLQQTLQLLSAAEASAALAATPEAGPAAAAAADVAVGSGPSCLPGSDRIIFRTGDVAEAGVARALHTAIAEQFQQPATLLVNNAAVQTWSPLLELDIHAWERTIRTNLTGCFVQIQAFATVLAEQGEGGSIINIGSGCNHLAFPHLVDYTASKGGVEMLTKSAALELGALGIRVNCLAPGAIANERTEAEAEGYAGKWAALTPLQRVGQERDVAQAVLWLTDTRAGFVTGQTIAVDGGLFGCARWPEDY